jgi:hypothetical protein
MQSQIHGLINDMAPISSLLYEILSMIFEVGHALQGVQPLEPPFELVISQVTQVWKTIATQMPRLWANTCISFDHWSLQRAVMYLARSKAVDVNFQIRKRSKRSKPLAVASIYNFVMPHFHCWHWFSIESNS